MFDDEVGKRAAARVGTVLNEKWTLERLLGVGGMAAVYAGRHRNGARAAVKVLHPHFARVAAIRDRFLREGYAANRVEHPGAVSVLDDDVIHDGPDDGSAYIVMEMLEGELLEDRAARGPIDEHELLEVADGILDVLASAHAHGVVHRDLKPDNLYLQRLEDGAMRVKVLDFGLARIVEERSDTRAGIALGTPAYMSPEQASGRAEEIDGRTDLFSVGAVMFRLRTGKRIHEAETAIDLVNKMAKVPAPKLRDVDATVSPTFAAIVDRALAFRREDRYADAASMRADVRAALLATAPSTSVRTPDASRMRGRVAFDATVMEPSDPTELDPPRGVARAAEHAVERDDEPPPEPPKSRGVLMPLLLVALLAGALFELHRRGIVGFPKSASAPIASTSARGPDAPALAAADDAGASQPMAREAADASGAPSGSAAPSASSSAENDEVDDDAASDEDAADEDAGDADLDADADAEVDADADAGDDATSDAADARAAATTPHLDAPAVAAKPRSAPTPKRPPAWKPRPKKPVSAPKKRRK